MKQPADLSIRQPWVGGLVSALLAAGLGLACLLFPLGKRLADLSYDLPFLFSSARQVEDIVIVFLDEESLTILEQRPEAFDRRLHAKLLDRLAREQAKLVVLDILFLSTNAVEGIDRQLAHSIRAHGKVVLGAQYERTEHLGVPSETVVPPCEPFRSACAAWGLVKVHRDTDFTARRHHPGTDRVPTLAWRAAEVLGLSAAQQAEWRLRPRWLNYYGPRCFRTLSFAQSLNTNATPGFSFRNKVVFVGAGDLAGFTGEEKDEFRYPWVGTVGHFVYGAQIHAQTFANLARQDWLVRWPAWLEGFFLVLTGWLAGWGLARFRPLAATGLAVGAVLLTALLGMVLQLQFHCWFSWLTIVLVQIPIGFAWGLIFQSLKAYLETRFLEKSLALYLSPQQVKRILAQPELLKPGAVQQPVSILFSDITSFSKISEKMAGEDLVRLLNDYYEATVECVHATEGTVINLIGDAIFAIWNAPQPQPNHPERACAAALALQAKLVSFDQAHYSLPLRTRVGLHTTVVSVGNIGSTKRFWYTAIGEGVNLASRLEGLNKHLGTNILASRDLHKRVERQLVSRLAGHFRFKGFYQVVEVHELLGQPEVEAQTRPWREAFAAALHKFQRRDFAGAERGFRAVLELRPEDGPSGFYLERIPDLRTRKLPDDWTGEIDLADK